LFENVLAPATISTDHPGYLSFIPCAPTEAAKLFDLVVSASAIYGGSWMEGAGAVYAENEVLTWLAKEAGLPAGAGGVFVQGGTLGNLSALVAARHRAAARLKAAGQPRPESWKFICSAEAHSSLKAAAAVMDVEIIKAEVDGEGRLRGPAVQAALDEAGAGVFAIVATGGTTNFGIVDKLDEIGAVANANSIWFHVDGAYGLAGILSPVSKPLFIGLEKADSFIVDPHKWLFAPFDACALLYRNPEDGRQAHTQHGEYLDTLTDSGDWNPSDYAYNLTRRPRGLPLWFSLATHGVRAYRDAVTHNVELAREIADEIKRRPGFELVREPELSVVVFTKDGWTLDDYNDWSEKLLQDGIAFVVPSSHQGKPNTRFAIVNPETSFELLCQILDSMENK
jgi:L-2,4-diaminobutyrate decarboxylase